MFWKFNLLTTHIDTILDKGDVTLHEVLDEDDVLQECKAQNRRLVDFLVHPENMAELVRLVTEEPPDDVEEKMRYKYPNTACELLTSDVSQITEHLAGEETLMAKVYSFLESDGDLNPLLASFFSKTMGLLISRKSEMMVELLQSKPDFVGQLLQHMGTSAIMDLLLRLITCIESPECRAQCIAWLNEQRLVQRLVETIDGEHSEEKHCNASQALCDIIRLSREQMSQLQERADEDPLLATLESEETVTDLLNHIFNGERKESVLVNGLTVIQTLLEFRKTGPEGGPEMMTPLDAERLAKGVNNTLNALIPRLKDFHQLLVEPPRQHYSQMWTTIGRLDPPLGNTRLQIAHLMALLVAANKHSVNCQLANLQTIGILLDLFFKYVWNNFLHTQVEGCLCTILNNSPAEVEEETEAHPLLVQLFTDVNVIERIMEAWEDNEQQQSRPGGHRLGFMGHLTKTANAMCLCMQKGANSERAQELYKELDNSLREKWETFTQGSLSDTNKQNTVELVNNQTISSSDDDDPDFRDIPFPQDTAMQQAFSDYQLQQMTSNFIDQFGFNEEEFTEQEESADAPFKDKISSINFDINTSEAENASQASLFEQACGERMQAFDDADSEEELFETKQITFAPSDSQISTQKLGKSDSKSSEDDEEEGSSDSDEDLDSPQVIRQAPATSSTTAAGAETMEVDSSDNWANFDDMNLGATSSGVPVAMDTGSMPWDAGEKVEDGVNSTAGEEREGTATQGEGWADFTSFQQMAESSSDSPSHGNSEALGTTDPGPQQRSHSPVAMDTNDETVPSNSRTAAYLVGSAPADLATQVSEAAPSSPCHDGVGSTNAHTSSPQQSVDDRVTATGDGMVAADSTVGSEGTTCHRDSPESTKCNRDTLPDSSNSVTNDTSVSSCTDHGLQDGRSRLEPADSSCSSPSIIQSSPVPPATRSQLIEDDHTDRDSHHVMSSSTPLGQPPLAEEEDYEDLNDNFKSQNDLTIDLSQLVAMEGEGLALGGSLFNVDALAVSSWGLGFLASVGLMKPSGDDESPAPDTSSSTASSSCSPPDSQSDQSNTPGEATAAVTQDTSKLEETRAQAKEALDQFSAATTTSHPAQNGPV